jgi:hypothetical protein
VGQAVQALLNGVIGSWCFMSLCFLLVGRAGWLARVFQCQSTSQHAHVRIASKLGWCVVVFNVVVCGVVLARALPASKAKTKTATMQPMLMCAYVCVVLSKAMICMHMHMADMGIMEGE